MTTANAWRYSPDFVLGDPQVLDRLLASVDLTPDDARAMNSIISWARTDPELEQLAKGNR